MTRPARKSRAYIGLLQFVYNLGYLVILILILPYLIFKLLTSPKHRAGLVQRMGILERWPDRGPRIWIHGVSVGEVLAAKSLVTVLERELPEHEVVISTTTRTGQAVARSHYPGHHVFYYPLDFSFATKRVLRRVHPQAVILMELEIWPNFLLSTSSTDVPVLLVNGRISAHSFKRYRILQRVIPEPLDRIVLYCVQTRTYRERFIELGVGGDRVKVAGTMKFDTINTEGADELGLEVRKELGIAPEERVLLAGSTHPTEEETLYGIYRALLAKHPEYRLIVVPRHPERLTEAEAALRKLGADVARKTVLAGRGPTADRPVILLDTMGELARIYAAADIAFVGGSLFPHGGQNMIEPAGLGRTVVFGPHIQNFQESVDILLDADAAVLVADAADLRRAILDLADDPARARAMGERARRIVIEHKGASERIMDMIRPYFSAPETGRRTEIEREER
jgi:3-deoxy-D-manno-octulosonic-acid transferase